MNLCQINAVNLLLRVSWDSKKHALNACQLYSIEELTKYFEYF